MLTEFLKKEAAQVVEYALIIAVVSIAVVSIAVFMALQPLSLDVSFGSFIGRVYDCLTAAVCV